jgi:hypothetical protein
MCARYGAICLIALFVASSDQESNRERGASKQLASPLPYTHLLTALNRTRRHLYAQRYSIGSQGRAISKSLIHKRSVTTAPGTVLMAPGPI